MLSWDAAATVSFVHPFSAAARSIDRDLDAAEEGVRAAVAARAAADAAVADASANLDEAVAALAEGARASDALAAVAAEEAAAREVLAAALSKAAVAAEKRRRERVALADEAARRAARKDEEQRERERAEAEVKAKAGASEKAEQEALEVEDSKETVKAAAKENGGGIAKSGEEAVETKSAEGTEATTAFSNGDEDQGSGGEALHVKDGAAAMVSPEEEQSEGWDEEAVRAAVTAALPTVASALPKATRGQGFSRLRNSKQGGRPGKRRLKMKMLGFPAESDEGDSTRNNTDNQAQQ
jgi:hypothetical protein